MPVFEIERDDHPWGVRMRWHAAGQPGGVLTYICPAGINYQRYPNDHSSGLYMPIFPGYGISQEPGGFGAVYYLNGTPLVVKEMEHSTEAVWELNVHEELVRSALAQLQAGNAALGLRNVNLVIASGTTRQSLPRIWIKYGLWFPTDRASRPRNAHQTYCISPALHQELRLTLEPRIDPSRPFNDIGAVAAAALQLTRGLAWLHAHQVAHCDVKVDNAMVLKDWRLPAAELPALGADAGFQGWVYRDDGVQLIDLGLSKKTHRGSSPSSVADDRNMNVTHVPPEGWRLPDAWTSGHDRYEGMVTGAAFDAWGLGLTIDYLMRRHLSVYRLLRHRERTLASAQHGSGSAPGPATIAEILACADIRRWYWAVAHHDVERPTVPASDAVNMVDGARQYAELLTRPAYPLPRQNPHAAPGQPHADKWVLAEDLVIKLLRVDPKHRLTPAAALQHPFLQWAATVLTPAELVAQAHPSSNAPATATMTKLRSALDRISAGSALTPTAEPLMSSSSAGTPGALSIRTPPEGDMDDDVMSAASPAAVSSASVVPLYVLGAPIGPILDMELPTVDSVPAWQAGSSAMETPTPSTHAPMRPLVACQHVLSQVRRIAAELAEAQRTVTATMESRVRAHTLSPTSAAATLQPVNDLASQLQAEIRKLEAAGDEGLPGAALSQIVRRVEEIRSAANRILHG